MPRPKQEEDLRLLTKVSKLYYEENLTQDEIMERLQLSRSKVSRLLQRARERGIVKITVVSPPGLFPDLEAELENRYHLSEAIVVEARDPQSQSLLSRELGIAAANYLLRTLQDNDVIGISWGTTLSYMVAALQPRPTPGAHVVQIIGGLGPPESEVHATDLCRRLAQLLQCRLTLLPAPGIVDHVEVKEAILSDSHVRHAFNLFSQINVAYVGIGAPTPDSVIMRDGSILSWDMLDDLLKKGAVGDIALRFFDAWGQAIISEVDQRVIGITLEQLRQIKRVVGVAGGPQKIDVIRGALRGRLINVLITDHITASQLVR
ncbi:sugar-binding transcriptional regulator [Thermanaerothrix sp. 4228-RoL]|uniref:Sugar-binding transcriptional regulator n=1 Tax=Thermanaerothrix solaris TaxID=3058434 RepID=A0ABU3NPC8_9CHLR|nr:sugar-binding transcriptional regulator [Thermanaerothrix sp. 4228-RoL]MDT8898700.1 sugar-binding transcriptional regulator [Thermanaerothrix sp. 4228-RoL]